MLPAAVAVALLQAAPSPVAPPPPPVATEPDVVVIGSTREYRLTARQLQVAVEAFDKHRPRYAPQSTLWFEVSARQNGSLSGVELALSDGAVRIPLPLGADGRFAYPAVRGAHWRLVSTRPSVPLRIRAWVVSPGSTPADLRLGDLKLQCRVGWAIARQSTSFVTAAMFDAIGGCGSSRIGMYQGFPRTITAASLEEGAKRTSLVQRPTAQMRLPTYQKGYSDEARIRLRFD